MHYHPPIQLLTTQLLSTQKKLESLEASLSANSASEAVKSIIVLAEGLDYSLTIDLQRRFPKLHLLHCTERPDFADLVQAAINHCRQDVLTIICNSDIWLDLEHSDLDSLHKALHGNPNLVFTLTRREDHHPEKLLTVDEILPEFLSSDAWIFSGLPRPFPCKGIYLGIQDMEQLVNYTLELSGYRLANACSWLRAVHLESSTNDYNSYNRDWLQNTVMENPLLAARGLPRALTILPPGLGPLDSSETINLNQLTPPWDEFTQRWILVDLREMNYEDCRISLLYLMHLCLRQKRFLIAYVDDRTDSQVVQKLDQFHRITGRGLCIQGFAMEVLMQKSVSENIRCVSSPALIEPGLLETPTPLICLSCNEKKPIRKSWIKEFKKKQIHDELQIIEAIDSDGVALFNRPENICLVHCGEQTTSNGENRILVFGKNPVRLIRDFLSQRRLLAIIQSRLRRRPREPRSNQDIKT